MIKQKTALFLPQNSSYEAGPHHGEKQCLTPFACIASCTTTPEKIYRAFIEPDALAKWLPPNGFACTVHHLEPKVGGTHRASFRNFTTGNSHAFGGEYLELVPNERLRYTDKFEDPNMPGEMHVTVTIKKVLVGTELNIVQEGIPDMIPPEACYLGWQELLRNLAKLVEPDIKD